MLGHTCTTEWDARDKSNSLSFCIQVDVEPVSGRLWQKKTQLQLNVGIRPQDVASPRWRPLNISYLSKAIPLVWTDRRVLLDSSEVGYYNYKVSLSLLVSDWSWYLLESCTVTTGLVLSRTGHKQCRLSMLTRNFLRVFYFYRWRDIVPKCHKLRDAKTRSLIINTQIIL